MNGSFAAGLFAAVLGLASFAPSSHAAANDTIDGLITGSVGGNAAAPSTDAKGSAAFRSALATLVGGDAPGAYELARALPNDTERRTVQWAAIYFNSGKIDHTSIARFAADAPNFASASLYKTRLEQSLTKADVPGSEVIRLLAGAMPNTIEGQIALASAYLANGRKDRATRIALSLWTENFLTEDQEKKTLAALGSLLNRDAHWTRAIHLMMNDRSAASERLIPYLNAGQKSLVVARAAVSRKDADAKAKLDRVDPGYQTNPVYIFSRAQRARQAELWQSAVDWLNKAHGELPDAAEWWYERRTLVRQALVAGQATLSYKAAAGYTHGPEGRLVDANFHAGWIALVFLHDPATAKAHFEKMRGLSTLADTVAQANYWLGKAELQLGNQKAAVAAYQSAARYETNYYGLLARAEMGIHGVDMRPLPAWQQSESLFNANEVVRAVKLLSANGQNGMAVPLLRNYAQSLQSGGELLLAARLAQAINANQVAISIADTAEKRGIPLDLFNYPKDGIPSDAKVAGDRAAVYAIARQESMFQVDAISAVGARGLMQLMPSTASDTAKKAGVAYSQSRLTSDARYNALLGSTYLAAQLDKYDGSLVLAAAAYNAGPGNASKWITAFGDPRANTVDPVIWVELIPFQETRKYVQRVLGNYLVYRERLGSGDMTITQALRKIP
ncbi:lytic transglycosylase domain-containing protein [Devosia sp.]|uniref:lytic transglycosylase domain-containing protein n=1 Tax=Devosia sp. TaxID=1871048 RepID=UPI003265C4AC